MRQKYHHHHNLMSRSFSHHFRVLHCTPRTWLHLDPQCERQRGDTVRQGGPGCGFTHDMDSGTGRQGSTNSSLMWSLGIGMCVRGACEELYSHCVCNWELSVILMGGGCDMGAETRDAVLSVRGSRWGERRVFQKARQKIVHVPPQQVQASAEVFALSFLSSLMGSGNSLYSSTSVSW